MKKEILEEFMNRNGKDVAAFLLAVSDVPGAPVLEVMEVLFEQEGETIFSVFGFLVCLDLVKISSGRLYLTEKGEELVASLRKTI